MKPQTNTRCKHCDYQWKTKSTLLMCTCPSCRRATEAKNLEATPMKYKIYYNPQIQYPELFQIGKIMYEVSTGKTWTTTTSPKNWTSTTIEADTPTQAIHILIQKLFNQ